MSFQGRFEQKMDEKGRFKLPSHLIAQDQSKSLKSQFVVTNAFYKSEKCLDLYTLKEWERLVKTTSQLPQFDQHVQAFQRFYISSAQTLEMDKSDRILIPTQLRNFGTLEDQVVVIGMGSKIEIWNQKSWEKVFTDISLQYDDILKTVSLLQQGRG
jgi:MraZ protein